mmetsp:Transcript_12594/g.37996  ORF Transcript_12594/g.37996 Transcript_12594/m.37996 type:complete len:360 (-) Transcript_12594:200-1279(-)
MRMRLFSWAPALSVVVALRSPVPLKTATTTRRAGLAGALAVLTTAPAFAADSSEVSRKKKEIALSLESAVASTAAASVAGAKVAEDFLRDPETQEKLKAARETALTVAKDTGTAAGNAAWDLARRARDGSLAQSASEVADVLSLPSRIAEASTKDDAAGAIAKAVDEWSRLPGVVSLAAASASSAQQLADAAQKSASAALADVEQRAESGELEDDAKSFFSVAGEVSRTVGLDTASSSLARAVGDAAVDVLSGALAQFSSSDEESFADSLNRAGARVSAAVDAAKNAAPAVAGFLAGLAVSWLFSLPSAFRLAYQRNEIARLTKDLDDANKKRAEATTSSSSSSSVVAPPAPASSSPSS